MKGQAGQAVASAARRCRQRACLHRRPGAASRRRTARRRPSQPSSTAPPTRCCRGSSGSAGAITDHPPAASSSSSSCQHSLISREVSQRLLARTAAPGSAIPSPTSPTRRSAPACWRCRTPSSSAGSCSGRCSASSSPPVRPHTSPTATITTCFPGFFLKKTAHNRSALLLAARPRPRR